MYYPKWVKRLGAVEDCHQNGVVLGLAVLGCGKILGGFGIKLRASEDCRDVLGVFLMTVLGCGKGFGGVWDMLYSVAGRKSARWLAWRLGVGGLWLVTLNLYFVVVEIWPMICTRFKR